MKDNNNFMLGGKDITKTRLNTIETSNVAANLNGIERRRQERKEFYSSSTSGKDILTVIVIIIILLQIIMPILCK